MFMSNSFAKIAQRKNDELYTPEILVKALSSYFEIWKDNFIKTNKRNPIIWCPFDTKDSEFVLFFKNVLNIEVVYSHINEGKDFFKYEPSQWDIAISNPPFSQKLDVFKRLDNFGKPWVMLTNIMCLNYMEIGHYFFENPGIQMIIPDKRVSFNGNPSSFCSAYFCRNFLNNQLEFVNLQNCNSGKDFKPSKMFVNKPTKM
jgi:hypothetical protein